MSHLLPLVVYLTGCLARPSLDRQSFVFAPPPPATTKEAPGGPLLASELWQVTAPFEGRLFVYRSGDFSYDHDPYAQFMTPAVRMECSLPSAVVAPGRRIRDVVESGSASKPDTLWKIQVEQLYGDFRHLENPAAVLAMRLRLF